MSLERTAIMNALSKQYAECLQASVDNEVDARKRAVELFADMNRVLLDVWCDGYDQGARGGPRMRTEEEAKP